MNFKEYDKIINEHKYDMLFLEIYYNLNCNDEFRTLTDEEKENLIHFIHRAYLKDETYTDLGCICDKALDYKDKIMKDNDNIFNIWDLLEKCVYTF